jgi:hypothetical protein
MAWQVLGLTIQDVQLLHHLVCYVPVVKVLEVQGL